MSRVNTNEEALQACRRAIAELVNQQESCINLAQRAKQAADGGGWDDDKYHQFCSIVEQIQRQYRSQIDSLKDCEQGLNRLIKIVQEYNA